MRASDLFESDYNGDLRSEVITLLTAVSAEGVHEIDTANLLADLQAQGYAVDEQSLMDLLSDIEIVSIATGDTISIATSDADSMVGAEAGEVEQDRVDNMAATQATKDIGESMGLRRGTPVVIVAVGSKYEGETGDVVSVDPHSVIVDLYNHGRKDFHRDDVELNDYADSEEEENDMYDREPDMFNESINRLRTLSGQNK
jgi:hypothetical protein